MNAGTAIAGTRRQKPEVTVLDREVARIKCYLMLMASDGVALAFAFLSANYIYLGHLIGDHGSVMLTVLTPIYLGIAASNSAYNGLVLDNVWHGVSRSLQAFAFSVAAILFIAYFLKAGSEFSRAVFLLGVVGATILLPLSRLVLRRPILAMLGGTPYSTVVIRDGVTYESRPFDIVVTPEELRFDPRVMDPMSFHSMAAVIANADRVIVACPEERYALWSSVLKGMAVDGEIFTDKDDNLGIIGISGHGKRRTMVVAAGPLNIRDRMVKRAFDIAFSACALIALSPVLIAAAIAIKLGSKGPILFVQDRIGRDNKIFRVYKFRSMYSDRCDADGSRLTSRADDRVTRVGEYIRRTSIDELPQLLNVLKGDMSMVGPRPHAISAKAADLLYWEVDPRYRHRHSMKPGLTGLAQIRGFRGATDRTEDLTNRLIADLEYAGNWSIWKDIWIILQTLRVLRHDNAY
jgi:exopolysaccharide biosynthesis polyprenyl glycosylphosphotransferase